MRHEIETQNAAVEIFELRNFYPAGDEQMTVFEVTGRSVPPGGIPLQVGCVVSNVATMINVYESSQDIPVTHKYVSILGEVKQPRIIRIPVGASLRTCLEAAGGTTCDDFAVIRGGPMMGSVITQEQLDSLFLKKTDGALIVLPADHKLVKQAALTEQQIIKRAKSCIQCGQCTELCPRYLIGHDLQPHKMMRAVMMGEVDQSCQEALLCCACGVCETYACPMGLNPRQINLIIANRLRAKGIRYQHDGTDVIARTERAERQIPPPRLISRLQLNHWDHQPLASFTDVSVSTVRILLQQHIGAPALPIVAVGDWVSVGQMIAAVPEGALGAAIHASIAGQIVAVYPDAIEISTAIETSMQPEDIMEAARHE